MLLLCQLWTALALQHRRIHDHVAKSVKLTADKFPRLSRRAVRAIPANGSAIRLFVDDTFLNDNSDELACGLAGQVITWDGVTYTCTSGDILTPEKKTMLTQTLVNVKQFLGELLKVVPFEGAFPLVASPDLPVSRPTSDGETDLYITVFRRPFGDSGAIAAAMAVNLSWDIDCRPVQGAVLVNVADIPGASQSRETTGDRGFFEVLVHELFHVLGVSADLIPFWINTATGAPYSSSEMFYMREAYRGKTFAILTTPELHAVAAKRWGSETF
jgi:hypothetical protein